MSTYASLSELQKDALRRALHNWTRNGSWSRSESAGDRVTFASLHTRGWLARRAWRGDGISRDSAFEYRPSDQVLYELAKRRKS